jgi:spermidine synthase
MLMNLGPHAVCYIAFLLIPWSGLPGTMHTAALINIVVALFAWLLVKSTPSPQTPQPQLTWEYQSLPRHSAATLLLLATALFTGFASFVYEVLWVRMLSMVLGASTHAFELMLSAFITGLALGSFAVRRWISRVAAPYRFLGYVQIIMGSFALGSLWVYNQSFDWMALLMQGVARTDPGYTVFLIASHLLCFLVMLPTTFMAGMTLPLITDGLLRDGYGERSAAQESIPA